MREQLEPQSRRLTRSNHSAVALCNYSVPLRRPYGRNTGLVLKNITFDLHVLRLSSRLGPTAMRRPYKQPRKAGCQRTREAERNPMRPQKQFTPGLAWMLIERRHGDDRAQAWP